jgi:hypothetical protein
MTVHELDERHQISSEAQTTEQLYDIDQHYQELESAYDVNQNQQVIEQPYDIYQRPQEINFYPEKDQRLTAAQQSSNHESYTEINSPQEINHYYQQTNDHRGIGMNYHAQENNLHVISNSLSKTKSKQKKSAAAQKRRNQKSSLRHRRNRYDFELFVQLTSKSQT